MKLKISELEKERAGLEDRIRRLEADLKCPLAADSSEQAVEISHQLILRRLLEVERSNLREVNSEIQKLRQSQVSGEKDL